MWRTTGAVPQPSFISSDYFLTRILDYVAVCGLRSITQEGSP